MKMLEIVNGYTAFHVSYRIADKTTPEGTSQERYDRLIAKLGKLKSPAKSGYFEDKAHTATSSWIVRSREQSADALGAKLGKGLTVGTDLLEVIEVSVDNWHQLTKRPVKPRAK
jgi:hypothetical protein